MFTNYRRVPDNCDDESISNDSAVPSSTPSASRVLRSGSQVHDSSQNRHSEENLVNDAFEDDDVEEPDDRQRLVAANDTVSSPPPRSSVSAPLGTYHAAVPTRPLTRRIYGGGIQSDGVFSNLAAKPERDDQQQQEMPPTYEQAAADTAPPYWETAIMPSSGDCANDIYIDGLPVGSFFSFLWNTMISTSFQLVGFLLTYLLHTTHASKNGSRAGLGITLIQYGLYLKDNLEADGVPSDAYDDPPDPNLHDFNAHEVGRPNQNSFNVLGLGVSDWFAYALMSCGWYIVIRALGDYLRAKRHQRLALQGPDRVFPVLGITPVANASQMV